MHSTPSAHLKLIRLRPSAMDHSLQSLAACRLRDEAALGCSSLHCGSGTARAIGCWVTVYKTLSPKPSAQHGSFPPHKRERRRKPVERQYGARVPVTLEQSCGP